MLREVRPSSRRPSGFRAKARLAFCIAVAVLAAAVHLSYASGQQAGPPPAPADGQTASLTIRIKDQTDALVPGARVGLTSPKGSKRIAEGETDRAGELYLPRLRPGTYAIEVEFPGFSMAKQSVILSAGVMSKVDVRGTLGTATLGEVVVAPKHPLLSHIKGLAHKIHF
jgi:hypothetical protein